MKSTLVLFLCSLQLIPAFAQLDLPWEEEGKESTEVQPSEPEKPSTDELPAVGRAQTAVSAAYDYFRKELGSDESDPVKFGNPSKTPRKITVSIRRHARTTQFNFVETSNDGIEATVEFGEEEGEMSTLNLRKVSGRWVVKPAPPEDPPQAKPTKEEPEPTKEPEASEPPEPEHEAAPPPPAKKPRSLTWTDLSSRRLAAMELAKLDTATLRLLRNEIYARHGRIFKSEDLKNYFENQTWYRPRVADVDDADLSDIEVANVRAIEAVEKSRKNNR